MDVAALLFGAPGHGAFVRAGTRGLESARDATGCELRLHFCESTDRAARIAALEALTCEGADLIVLHGGQGEIPLEVVAPAWPSQRFALSQGHVQLPNVACYEVVLEQAAFLAGAMAAWSSTAGRIAHLSGEAVGPGLRGLAAFRAGALQAVPGIAIDSHFCGRQHDPALAARCVRAHARMGADVLFTMLGEGRLGAIEACRDTGMKQIGDVIDWCAVEPDVFIASAVADSAWCTEQAVLDLHAGRLAPGTRRSTGLAQPAVCRLAVHPQTDAALRQRLEGLHRSAVAYCGS